MFWRKYAYKKFAAKNYNFSARSNILEPISNVDASENLKLLQEILPEHYLQSCSVRGAWRQ